MSDRHDPLVAETTVSRPLVAAVVLAALVLVLAVQNSERLHLHLLFWTVSTPAYGLVAMSAVLGAAVAASAGGLWRRRRRVHDDDRRELDRLRRRRNRPDRTPEVT